MKHPVIRAGQSCPKCGTRVVRRSHAGPDKPQQSYFFRYWFACPNDHCGALYMVQRARCRVADAANVSAPLAGPRSAVHLYPHGGTTPHAGRGGWSAVLVRGTTQKKLCGAARPTTTQRMELTAVLRGLEALRVPCRVTVVTNSPHVIGWLTRGWRQHDRAVRTLCAAIHRVARAGQHELAFEMIAARSGQAQPERACAPAEQARKGVAA